MQCSQDSLKHTDRWKAWIRLTKMSWKTLTERDLHEWNLNEADTCDKDVWRSSVRSAMRTASQLPGRDMLEYSAGFETFVMLLMNVPSSIARENPTE